MLTGGSTSPTRSRAALAELYPKALVMLKLDADGALVYEQGAATHIPAGTNNLVDATGAGDSFAGGVPRPLPRARPTRSPPPVSPPRISAWVIEHLGARPEPNARLRAILGVTLDGQAAQRRSRTASAVGLRAFWRPPHALIEHHRELRFFDGSCTTQWQWWHALRRLHDPSATAPAIARPSRARKRSTPSSAAPRPTRGRRRRTRRSAPAEADEIGPRIPGRGRRSRWRRPGGGALPGPR